MDKELYNYVIYVIIPCLWFGYVINSAIESLRQTIVIFINVLIAGQQQQRLEEQYRIMGHYAKNDKHS